MERQTELDWLRGLMLVLMTVTHLPTWFSAHLGQPFGFVSAAEGFVFLSAYLVGSVYWRSWWLQHYPSAGDIEQLSGAAYVYVTHEHPDHFHMPSIRRLGTRPTYLFPALSERGYLGHIKAAGYRAEIVPPLRWQKLDQGVSILSIPLWNDDSVLLIDTPDALILNLNDAKPLPTVLRALRRLAERVDKRRILLCSYSPASLVNSFRDEAGVVSLKRPEDYVAYVCRLCDALGADFYIPFASQASFERPDSAWANQYRTGFADLQRGWTARAELLPPYTTLDLTGFGYEAVAAGDYRPAKSTRLVELTGARDAAETGATIDADDLAEAVRVVGNLILQGVLLSRRRGGWRAEGTGGQVAPGRGAGRLHYYQYAPAS